MRVDVEIKTLIQLAQSRGWSRDAFLARIKQIWGKTEQGTKDIKKDIEHNNWMKQIRL